jgi:hypothetical protein
MTYLLCSPLRGPPVDLQVETLKRCCMDDSVTVGEVGEIWTPDGKSRCPSNRNLMIKKRSRPQTRVRNPSPDPSDSPPTDSHPEDKDDDHLPYVCVTLLSKLPPGQFRLMCTRVPQCFRTPRASQVPSCTARNRRIQADHRRRKEEEAAT